MEVILSTPRLVLKKLTLNDTAFILELVNTPGWLKYIGDRNIHTTEQAVAYLQNGPLKSYAENGFGLWLITLQQGGTAAGIAGLIKRPHLHQPDVGFALLPQYQGNGYTQEIVKAIAAYASNMLMIPHLLAIVMPENTASINVLEKCGFTCRKTLPATDKEPQLLLYSNEVT